MLGKLGLAFIFIVAYVPFTFSAPSYPYISYVKQISFLFNDDEASLSEKEIDELVKKNLSDFYDGKDSIEKLEATETVLTEFFAKLNDKNSSYYQQQANSSLATALRQHGLLLLQGKSDVDVINKNVNVRQLLIDQSGRNKKRILHDIGYNDKVKENLNVDFVQFVSQVAAVPFHNTIVLKNENFEIGETPLLSSKLLSNLGLKGLNSKLKYNWKFLKSDSAVFFNIYLRLRTLDENDIKGLSNEYGSRSFTLRGDFIKDHAFLSPFIMYSNHFNKLFKLQNIDIKKNHIGMTVYKKQIIKSQEPFLSHLYLFDFTLNDYEEMIRSCFFMAVFNGTYTSDDVKKMIEEEDNDKINSLIEKIAHLPRFELKIPGAVPASAVIQCK